MLPEFQVADGSVSYGRSALRSRGLFADRSFLSRRACDQPRFDTKSRQAHFGGRRTADCRTVRNDPGPASSARCSIDIAITPIITDVSRPGRRKRKGMVEYTATFFLVKRSTCKSKHLIGPGRAEPQAAGVTFPVASRNDGTLA